MKAIVLQSDFRAIGPSKFPQIMQGNLDAIKAMFKNMHMQDRGTLENVQITDVNKFLEWCFDETNLNEEWKSKNHCRGMGVGDILMVIGQGNYACLPVDWAKI